MDTYSPFPHVMIGPLTTVFPLSKPPFPLRKKSDERHHCLSVVIEYFFM